MNIANIQWAYEDELPKMSDAEFDAIYKASRVDIVRLYPYIEHNGTRIWLTN